MARRLTWVGACLILLNSAYLASYSDPTLFFVGNVLFHVGGGILFVGLLIWRLWGDPRRGLFTLLLLVGGLGLILAKYGAIRPNQGILWAHIVLGIAAMILLAWDIQRKDYVTLLVACLVFPLVIAGYRARNPDPWARIRNSPPPLNMDGEGDGPKGLFFPSSATTSTGGRIPSNFFMESKSCEPCHQQIYQEWESSVHHFGSFNNQFYRKSIEYMQEVTGGTKPSRWCAGCHDHALLFSGMFDRPIKEVVNTPEAQAGLGCMSCHAIVQARDSMGNGGFRIEYPALHDLAVSKNAAVRWVGKFVTIAAPKAHRRTFMKPFMRQDSPEFCSTCHKVHLDVPVNSYRWIRGFNEYDGWQASGVSGQGARSFYYPKESSTCTQCHMPLTSSSDFGNINGQAHNHRFLAANTAVPFANNDHEQLNNTREFLRSGYLTVDIFAVAPVRQQAVRAAGAGEPQLSTSFAVGEEAMPQGGVIREARAVVAPIDKARAAVKPGDEVMVEVVVRTRKVGHFFPGGTVDSFDVWVELEAFDAEGRRFYHSGYLENGNGPVEKGAHFYRSFQLDAHGNPIDKRNAFSTRSVLYARLIPPGAADVVHYRVKIPPYVSGPVRLQAKVNYRKFAWFYTQFAYAGVMGTGTFTPHFDDRPVAFTGNLKQVSGAMKKIPDVPVVAVAEASTTLAVGTAAPVAYRGEKSDRERWNDYGIGLLLQGDLKGAEAAFTRVTELDPGYADGYLNVARCLVQEGETEAARPWIEKALGIDSRLARAHFFKALVLKAAGEYDRAQAELKAVLDQYPRDRVALNQVGRIHFLKREYQQGVTALQKVLDVDPEDLQAHYTLMLCYRGLKDEGQATREEKLYLRFKAEESAQAITGDYRRIHPADNNERQMIHEHE